MTTSYQIQFNCLCNIYVTEVHACDFFVNLKYPQLYSFVQNIIDDFFSTCFYFDGVSVRQQRQKSWILCMMLIILCAMPWPHRNRWTFFVAQCARTPSQWPMWPCWRCLNRKFVSRDFFTLISSENDIGLLARQQIPPDVVIKQWSKK